MGVESAAGPHRLVLATYLDAPNRPQPHSQILMLTLTLTLDAWCVSVARGPWPLGTVK